MEFASRSFKIVRFSTTSPDEGHAYLRRTYTDFALAIRGSEQDFRFSSDFTRIATGSISRVRHSMAVALHARDGIDRLGVHQRGRRPPATRRPGANTGSAPVRRWYCPPPFPTG
ncbi:hypothetical protein FHX74_003774 [Friedmanniella endophytica]|uniref:Uncharacterized protein n=1 Tax=Microlunatus kandeliicorticis TaxID=1759536 RepID=A0A7W3IVN0_9ACTN|nr:hypothetical protein [Microlunatus kandeliicorticis]MBA8796133.1 hypothetical protein [Microlunatus kandeliicorticis]